MRYAAHPPPDRFHLLRLAKPLLESLALGLRPPLLGDVLHRSNDVDVARVISYGAGHDAEVFDPAIRH